MNMMSNTAAQPPLSSSDYAAKDLIDLLENNEQGIFMPWLYQNGGSRIFTDLSSKNPYYVLRRHEKENMADNAIVLGAKLKDTNTVAIVGGADAVTDKELKVMAEMVKQNPEALKKVVLIDLSAEFNRVAYDRVMDWVQTLPENIQGRLNVECIDKSIQNLSEEDLKKIHQGNVAAFSMGGTVCNPEGTISGGLPDGRMKDFMGHVTKIAANPKSDSNHVVMGYTKHADPKSYTHIPEHDPQASSEYWFMNGLLYNMHQIEGIEEANRGYDFPDGFSIPALRSKLEGYYYLDKPSRTSKNGLKVKEEFKIVIPYQGGHTICELKTGTSLVFANSVHPQTEDMDRLARTLSPNSLHSLMTCKHSDPKSGSVVELFSVQPKLTLAA